MSKKSRRIQSNNPPPLSPKPPQNQSIAQIQFEQYQGLLPHPKILDEYDQIVPGAAERIIRMAEDQAKHRQDLEKMVIGSDTTDSNAGLKFGFILALLAIICGTSCILYGYSVSGGIMGGGAVPSLAGVFVYGSRQRRKEREAKQAKIINK